MKDPVLIIGIMLVYIFEELDFVQALVKVVLVVLHTRKARGQSRLVSTCIQCDCTDAEGVRLHCLRLSMLVM